MCSKFSCSILFNMNRNSQKNFSKIGGPLKMAKKKAAKPKAEPKKPAKKKK